MRNIIKNVTAILAVIFFTAFLATSNIQAENFDSTKAYQDYQHTLTNYNQTLSDFKYAKNAYAKNPTLGLKEEFRQKTTEMLRSRDQLITVYLNLLKVKVTENTGLTNDEKNGIYSRIDEDVKWYENDKTKYSGNDPIETLFERNEESKDKYQTGTLPIINETLSLISLGQEITLRISHEQEFSKIKALIDAGVSDGKLSLSPFNRWFTDIDATNQTLKQNEDNIRQEIVKTRSQSQYSNNICEACSQILTSSKTSLSQFNEYLVEILNYIKNQQ